MHDAPKILIVNDDQASLIALSSQLIEWARQHDCEIITALSGEDALRRVLQHDFAVILLDVNMPMMDGFETAEAIHMRERSASVPIIFVTALLADEMNGLKGYQKGAVDYLFTPVIPQILQAKVSVFVALAKKNAELRRRTWELNRRSEELSASNARLEKEVAQRVLADRENQAKDEFLAMLGHELRNPINAITTATSLLRMSNVKSTVAERAKEVIHRQSAHLAHIVDDLLDLSRVISGKILLSCKTLDLATEVANCMETFHSTARAAHHRLTLNSAHVAVNADPTRLEQIITNLLDNALKYTPAGGDIDISVGEENGCGILEIRDSGIGISAELLPNIFDVFVQGERSLDRSNGGLGIGLALVQRLARLHGGEVSVTSAGIGKGSLFKLYLPLGIHPRDTMTIAPVREKAKARRVLIVEDNDDAREMLRETLIAHGHHVITAPNGKDGLLLAESERPDLAFVDIGLPGMDGYEFARRLRASLSTSIHLIALTGYGQEQDKRKALEAGFDSHLIKPVHINRLLDALLF
ncbi:MAG: hybrid sensor histidine kinase/response regulator [Herbaspirillum sp.]|nr:hybrid sensor histidine kinase/response regulator [Herbaspirillum sp.]